MKVIKTDIEGVLIIETDVFGDHRGYFTETYNKPKYEALGITNVFVQDNMSFSAQKGTLRGLHWQNPPYAQAKLVSCSKGRVIDVAVDIRKSSPTFGQHVMVELSEDNKRQFFIPRGFAHGFLVLSEEAIFTYKVDNPYAPQVEAGIRWNDPALKIVWPIDPAMVQTSEKDLKQPFLKDAELFD